MVTNLLKKGIKALVFPQTTILSAAFFIMITTIVSQVLGVIKYRFLVSIFGASKDLGVFLAAFRIPDLIFQVLIVGAFSSAFIPVFSGYVARGNKEEADRLSSSLITISLILFVLLIITISIFSYPISHLIAPGFSEEGLLLMSRLMRLILISQIFFILGTIATSMLQSLQHFLVPGIAASLYNLGIILGIFLFAERFGIFGAAIGALLGSFLFFVFQVPLLRTIQFRFKPTLYFGGGVKRVLELMPPRSLTLLLAQIGALSNLFFASFVEPRERSYLLFDLAQTVVVAVVILLGNSIAQASFPALSSKSRDKEGFLAIFMGSFTQILYLVLPISAILIVLRIPVIRLFYGAARFDWQATVDTGITLSFFALSLFAQALIPLLSRAFYSLQDTKTPFLVTGVAVFVNIFLSYIFIFINRFPIYYLALSFSIANLVGIILMLILLDRKISLPKIETLIVGLKIFIATFIMGMFLYIPIKLLDQLVIDTTRTIGLVALTGIAGGAGFTAYIFFTWFLDIKEAYLILSVIRKFGNWRKILRQVEEPIGTESKLNP